LITFYIQNDNVIECLSNRGSINYFPDEYLNAIKNKDIDYLYSLGEDIYKKRKTKNAIINFLSKTAVM
jgi:hypothetical protein